MNAAKSTKLDYINAVRGLAILMVIFLHVSSAVPSLPATFLYMSGKGSYGVQLFFIASAFTLFLSYANRVKTEGAHVKRNFFIRRFFRISPMYYLAALVYAVIYFYVPAYNDGKPLVVWKVITNVLYLNGITPGAINYIPPGGWSVGVEMLFYCCVPFLFTWIKNIKSALIWFIILSVFAFILKLLIRYLLSKISVDYHNAENWFLYFWFPNQAAVFMLGIILYFAIKKYKIKSRIYAYAGMIINTFLLLIVTYFKRDADPYLLIPEQIIVAVFFTINIYFLSQHTAGLFDNRLIRFFGEISFSLYLVHFIVVKLLVDYFPLPDNIFAQYFVLLGLTLVISSLISKITYKFIEQNGVYWGNRYIKRKALKAELNAGI